MSAANLRHKNWYDNPELCKTENPLSAAEVRRLERIFAGFQDKAEWQVYNASLTRKRQGLVNASISHREVEAGRFCSSVSITPAGLVYTNRTENTAIQKPPVSDRGEITAFSEKSRRRLLDRLMLFQWAKHLEGQWKRSKSARACFITLTYPGHFCGDPETVKRDLDALGKRLARLRFFRGMLWKQEWKERKSGASKGQMVPHYHGLLLLTERRPLSTLRRWFSVAWAMICGGDAAHRKAGTQILPAYGEGNRLFQYLAKYLGKTFDAGFKLGRVWGVISGRDPEKPLCLKSRVYDNPLDLAPVDVIQLDRKDSAIFARRLRRWAVHSPVVRKASINRNRTTIYGNPFNLCDLLRGLNWRTYFPPDFGNNLAESWLLTD